MRLVIGELTSTQKLEAADLHQKLVAIDAALAKLNDRRVAVIGTFNQKQVFLENERKTVMAQFEALREATLEE